MLPAASASRPGRQQRSPLRRASQVDASSAMWGWWPALPAPRAAGSTWGSALRSISTSSLQGSRTSGACEQDKWGM